VNISFALVATCTSGPCLPLSGGIIVFRTIKTRNIVPYIYVHIARSEPGELPMCETLGHFFQLTKSHGKRLEYRWAIDGIRRDQFHLVRLSRLSQYGFLPPVLMKAPVTQGQGSTFSRHYRLLLPPLASSTHPFPPCQ